MNGRINPSTSKEQDGGSELRRENEKFEKFQRIKTKQRQKRPLANFCGEGRYRCLIKKGKKKCKRAFRRNDISDKERNRLNL